MATKKKKKKLPRHKRYVRYWCWRLSKLLKLPDKVGTLNSWATRNPKIFFRSTVGILSFVVFTSIVSLGVSYLKAGLESRSQENNKETVSQQETFGDPMVMDNINHFQQIDDTKKVIRNERKALTDKGLFIKHELDSLMALPVKTHDDSIQIVMQYNNLKIIVDFLKNNGAQ